MSEERKPTISEVEWMVAAPEGYFVTTMLPNGEIRATLGPKLLAIAQPAASAEDARRYAMLFRPTWRNGKGVGVFSYTGYPASPRRISIQEANEHLDAIGDHHD